MHLDRKVLTFGRYMRERHGRRVHKVALNAAFTCPNIIGEKGTGGCTFCNNASFSPNARRPPGIDEQLAAGMAVIRRRTGARHYLAYFQAYTNTYGDVTRLRALYDQALAHPAVMGLAVGTRPDAVPDAVLDLLAGYAGKGYEIWLELGLQSADDRTLARVNRGHGFAEYRDAIHRARGRGLRVCTHLMVGLPGETVADALVTLDRVLEEGTDGLKLHPLHVVRGTRLAIDYRRGDYRPLERDDYIACAVEHVRRCPADMVFHRLTATAPRHLLCAPDWCGEKWSVLNDITRAL